MRTSRWSAACSDSTAGRLGRRPPTCSTSSGSATTATGWCAPLRRHARRLDLGASLVGSPRLLLLDEPTTGLDPRSRLDLWDTIRDLVATGTDVLLTTQYLDEADHLAHDIVIFDRGTVIASGTPSELKTRAGRDVVEVHVRDAATLPAAAHALSRLDGAPRVDEPTRRVSVTVDAGTDRLTEAVRLLDALGIALDDIALRRPSLDEVFLALTGWPIESPGPTARPHAA